MYVKYVFCCVTSCCHGCYFSTMMFLSDPKQVVLLTKPNQSFHNVNHVEACVSASWYEADIKHLYRECEATSFRVACWDAILVWIHCYYLLTSGFIWLKVEMIPMFSQLCVITVCADDDRLAHLSVEVRPTNGSTWQTSTVVWELSFQDGARYRHQHGVMSTSHSLPCICGSQKRSTFHWRMGCL